MQCIDEEFDVEREATPVYLIRRNELLQCRLLALTVFQ